LNFNYGLDRGPTEESDSQINHFRRDAILHPQGRNDIKSVYHPRKGYAVAVDAPPGFPHDGLPTLDALEPDSNDLDPHAVSSASRSDFS
jgi:hypothetical protein